MLGLWVLYGLAVVAGIATPLALLARDRRIDARRTREVCEGIGQDVHTLGMLSGGPGRMVDAIVTDLVERGLVVADNGSLAVSADHADQDLGELDSFAVHAVRDVGHEGIWEVRRRFGANRAPFRSVFAQLSRNRLLISPMQRTWEPAGVALAVLVVLSVATFGMMFEYPGRLTDREFQLQGSAAIVGWLTVTILVATLMSRRRGYHGPDPRSALGLAGIAMLRSELPGDAAQARRVALGGFEAMTDAPLRKAIQGTDVDSVWQVPRRREDAFGIDLVAVDLAHPGGADGGGGDGGGD